MFNVSTVVRSKVTKTVPKKQLLRITHATRESNSTSQPPPPSDTQSSELYLSPNSIAFIISEISWVCSLYFTLEGLWAFWDHHHHQSLNHEGRLGTTDNSATSLLHFSLFSTALWDLPNSRPVHFPDAVFPPLPVSALSSSPFHCALQDGFGQTWWTGDMSTPLQFVSLYDRQEVFVWSNCLLNLGTGFLIGNMVFVRDV